MQVKVASGDGAIGGGTRLTAAVDGSVRALQTRAVEGMVVTEGAPVIGVALEAANKDGQILGARQSAVGKTLLQRCDTVFLAQFGDRHEAITFLATLFILLVDLETPLDGLVEAAWANLGRIQKGPLVADAESRQATIWWPGT